MAVSPARPSDADKWRYLNTFRKRWTLDGDGTGEGVGARRGNFSAGELAKAKGAAATMTEAIAEGIGAGKRRPTPKMGPTHLEPIVWSPYGEGYVVSERARPKGARVYIFLLRVQ